jgi:hypothetical protein
LRALMVLMPAKAVAQPCGSGVAAMDRCAAFRASPALLSPDTTSFDSRRFYMGWSAIQTEVDFPSKRYVSHYK